KIGERRAPATVSVRRLEGKVDELASQVRQDRGATAKNTERVDNFTLNGSARALSGLASVADQLTKLAIIAPRLIEIIERESDRAAAHRYIRRVLNPLKPFGALVWLLFTTVVTAIAWNLLTRHP